MTRVKTEAGDKLSVISQLRKKQKEVGNGKIILQHLADFNKCELSERTLSLKRQIQASYGDVNRLFSKSIVDQIRYFINDISEQLNLPEQLDSLWDTVKPEPYRGRRSDESPPR